MRVLDLFSGIGGFSLGLQRVGMTIAAFCEANAQCRKVLKRHWPTVPIFTDARKLCRRIYDCAPEDEQGFVLCPRCNTEFGDCACIGSDEFLDRVGYCEVITAGFPCQNISLLNNIHSYGDGIHGEKSKLYREVLRIACELEPQFLIMENVEAIVQRGLGQIIGELSEIGYDAEWHVIPASAIGAEHRRNRVWIIAHHQSLGIQRVWPPGFAFPYGMARAALSVRSGDNQWKVEPSFCREIHGVSGRVDRLKQLGNAVLPQIPALIGKAIIAAGTQVKNT